jgi:hypothetical protein
MVFQPPQSGQRPSQRGAWCPQAWQEKLVLARIVEILTNRKKSKAYLKEEPG